MSRKLRIEYEGAMYHVINRGNYRADIFGSEGAKDAFEQCLWEACGKTGWRVHAYVVMRNHYHLAVETPGGNLVEGMRWLQATYANRFNRFRKEQGHVFQGRYKALVVEDGTHMGNLCNYIHLNPVRAGICGVEELAGYRHGSYARLEHPEKRPTALTFEMVLSQAGGLRDDREGWASYAAYLKWLSEDEAEQKKQAFERMCSGWALGSDAFRKDVIKDQAGTLGEEAPGEADVAELRELKWSMTLERCLRELGQTTADIRAGRKAAPWKVAVAAYMKAYTSASNPWLAEALHMGSPAGVSRYVAESRRTNYRECGKEWSKISKVKV